jgi:hypothetical protein
MRSLVWGTLALAMLAGCGIYSSKEALESSIFRDEQRLRPLLANANSGELDDICEGVVASLLRDYARYANGHHGDSLANVFLMRRADLLQGMGDFSAAIEQWMNVAEGAVHSELAAEAIFRIGFIRESALQDTLGALKAYGELVRVYPESDWSGSAIEAAKWLSFNETEMMKVLDKGRE